MTTNQQVDSKAKAGKGPGPFTEGMSWDSWAERFDFFIKLRGITDPETKKLLLFTEIRPIYEELRSMAQPDDVRTMTLTDIMALMADDTERQNRSPTSVMICSPPDSSKDKASGIFPLYCEA